MPGADNSGDRVRHKRSRDGNRYLKLAFSHAAVRAVQYYPEVRAWYGSKKRKKPEAVARALVAKELARIVYHVLRKQQDFNGQFKGKPLSRTKKELWPLLPSPAGRTGAGEPQARPPSAGNGKVRGVPPTEIWDDVAGARPPSRPTTESPYGGCGPPALRGAADERTGPI